MAFRSRINRAQPVEVLKPRLHEKWWVQFLLVIWRWWIEIAIVAAVIYFYLELTEQIPGWAAVCVLVAPVTLALCLPGIGPFVRGWAWCLVTRHRVRSFMTENGIRNRSGKLPWILATYPTPVGERVWLLLIAGMSIDDIKDRTSALAATCWASDARVDRTRRFAGVLRIDIIRRDPLASKKSLPSTLVKTVPGEVVVSPAAGGRRRLPEWASEATPKSSATTQDSAVDGADNASGNGASDGANRTTTARAAKARSRSVDPAPAGPVVLVNGEDVSDYV